VSWEFLTTQVRKKDLRGKGYLMDLNIRYGFAEGEAVLLVLVEHWAQARNVDLVRTAHYYLDLMERFPDDEIIPVALITERKEHNVSDSIAGQGDGEEFLRFRTRVVQLAREEADRWASTSNLVANTLLLAMGGLWDGARRLITAAEAFRNSATDTEVALLFPLFVEVGKLDEEEEESIMSYLATMPKPRLLVKMEQAAIQEGLRKGMEQGLEQGLEKGLEQGLEQGLQKGLLRKAREDARRMLAKGFSWADITDITGLSPEDLAD